jgi:uncharacterized protein (DUF1697 family)
LIVVLAGERRVVMERISAAATAAGLSVKTAR